MTNLIREGPLKRNACRRRGRSGLWFIDRRRPIVDRVADLNGTARVVATCRVGGVLAICCVLPWDYNENEVEDEKLGANETDDPETQRQWIRMKITELIERYRQSRRFTDRQIFMIERLMLDGWALRELARYWRVKPAAVSCHIKAVRFKAPEFYTWWAFKNRNRR